MQNSEPDDLGDIERSHDAWQSWAQNPMRWRGSVTEQLHVSRLPEWWELEPQHFVGAWLLQDMTRDADTATLAVCMARVLVVGLAHRYVREGLRGEDGAEDFDVVKEYIDALPLPATERRSLESLMTALQPYDARAACDALLAMVWSARRRHLDYAVRCCAQLAYDCALGARLHECAGAAARALADVATRQECPRSARRWRGRAFIHTRRALS